MTPEQFQRHVSHGYSVEFHVLGWAAGQLDDAVTWLLVMAAAGVVIIALFALLVTAAPTVVLFRYRERITARFCPQYRRPERDREDQCS